MENYLNDNNIKGEESQNLNNEKLQFLCITWNVGGGIVNNDYDISEIFKKNQFYKSGQFPDIVIVSF